MAKTYGSFATTNGAPTGLRPFTPYEKGVVAMLAFLQFTIILDFMILSPLGAILMPALNITPGQFGWVVSAYAFSAGASGLLAAGFADKFDRKKLLLFFYTGFLGGTLFCALAPNYELLLAARIMTGLFGGVMGSIVFAITTDLFPWEMRGRVMGAIQTSFAASQVLGIPVALYLSNLWGWHSPFLAIVVLGAAVGVLIAMRLKPVNEHLSLNPDKHPVRHLFQTLTTWRYVQAFAATALLSVGGFMLMPFSSAFSVNNLGIGLDQLPMVYMITGICAMLAGPVIGRISDSVGKFKVFFAGCVVTISVVLFYTRLGVTPLWAVILISVAMFVGISSRMIAASALVSGVPAPADRGAYMSVSSSLQQISGGLAAALAGMIVVQNGAGPLEHFDVLGDVVAIATVLTVGMMYRIHRMVSQSRN